MGKTYYFVLILFLVCCFIFNVALHEFGHYLGALYFELNPSFELDFVKYGNANYGLAGFSVASTSFDIPDFVEEEAFVILLGPFMNLILCFIFSVLLVYEKKNYDLRFIFILGSITSIVSFFMNLIPIEGNDGWHLFRLLN